MGDQHGPLTTEEIRAIRERLGLSEAEFADALSLGNRNTIIREYQSGKRSPAPPTVRLMRLLDVCGEVYRLLKIGRIDHARALLGHELGAAIARADATVEPAAR